MSFNITVLARCMMFPFYASISLFTSTRLAANQCRSGRVWMNQYVISVRKYLTVSCSPFMFKSTRMMSMAGIHQTAIRPPRSSSFKLQIRLKTRLWYHWKTPAACFATPYQAPSPICRFLEALCGPGYSDARSNPYSFAAVDGSIRSSNAQKGAPRPTPTITAQFPPTSSAGITPFGIARLLPV